MISVAGLDISFHRLGREGWSTESVLRSWAEAKCQIFEDGIVVACLPSEVIWLGLTNTAERASVVLTSLSDCSTRSLLVPPDWQLGWLLDLDGKQKPLALAEASSAIYRLEVRRTNPDKSTSVDLSLISPADWPSHLEPLNLTPAAVPPPVPRYSRIVRPKAF